MSSAAEEIRTGQVLFDARRFAEAVSAFDRAIALAPARADAHSLRGRALLALGRKAEGLASALQATKIDPASAPAWIALGSVFYALRQHELALKAWRSAQRLAPDRPGLSGLILQAQMLCCDWDGLDSLVAAVTAELEAGKDAVHPFYWHAIADSPESLLQAAQNRQRRVAATLAQPPRFPPPQHGGRIRIGYLSGELNLAANGLVMAGVFDHHDRDRFEIIAFDNGGDDGTPLRQRIASAFAQVIDVRSLSDAELAARIRAEAVDILVDLNGYFGNSRSAVLGHRAAPVQVSFLGCPATNGAAEVDYAIADAVVVPEEERQWHSEAVVHLPDTYYPADRQREISDRRFTRTECGLPEDGFVFACFNHCHKILPETFVRWMRILTAVEGSVLWLLDANPVATSNLHAEAARHGVDPARLVFAPRLPPGEHLARHRCADLALDSLPYNGHTTTTDALWAGLPVLTLAGSTWPGRVAASVLQALGLPELVTASAADYEQQAIRLATQPDALAAVREALAARRLTAPLFDTARYTQHLESAYRAMHDRRCQGLAPGPITIAAQ